MIMTDTIRHMIDEAHDAIIGAITRRNSRPINEARFSLAHSEISAADAAAVRDDWRAVESHLAWARHYALTACTYPD